jgi:hypothetical protein
MEACEVTPNPINLNLTDPRNEGVLQFLQSRNRWNHPPTIPLESVKDSYMSLGSHPEVVERLWDQLAPSLPDDCRSIVYGTPALVAPKSGIVFAVAIGTQYALRVPSQMIFKAVAAGAKTTTHWSGGGVMDVSKEFGTDWIFGAWLKQEPEWCLACYRHLEEEA